jgi:putative transposase
MAVDTPHHVTQRGNARQFVLESEVDRRVYLDLLRQYSALHELSLLGYCLMSNHVHLIVVPRRKDSLARALKNTHGRYAAYWNVRQKSSGHVWQGRYYSCPLDTPHLWAALRYAELNPVRAGIASTPDGYVWSSAAAHCAKGLPDGLLDMDLWRRCWDAARWREYLASGGSDAEAEVIRKCTHTGRPLGASEFIAELEKIEGRRLVPQKGGRPEKQGVDIGQGELALES